MFQQCLAQWVAGGTNTISDKDGEVVVFHKEKHGPQETNWRLVAQLGDKL